MQELEETQLGDETWVDEGDELPPRPRIRWMTPLTAGLAAVVIAAAGFIAGVLVEKGQGGTGNQAAAGFRRAAAGGAFAGAGAGRLAAGGGPGGSATVGQVSSVQGHKLYVTTTSGNTVEVDIPSGEQVTRTTTAGVRDVHPGDTVIVQGSQGSNGAISASSVRATAADASGGGLGALFGGGGGAGGGTGTGGGRSSGGGAGGSVNQLFGGG